MTKKNKLILASTSRTRIEILKKVGFKFSSIPPKVEEVQKKNECPEAMSLRLAQEKSLSVAKDNPDALIIGSDQVAVCNGLILNKPLTKEKAIKQLLWQRGQKTEFFTSIAVSRESGSVLKSSVVKSTVVFLDQGLITDEDILNYVGKENPLHCAGSAKFEGIGVSLLKRVSCEDPNALLGLPLIKLCIFLNEWGISPLNLAK